MGSFCVQRCETAQGHVQERRRRRRRRDPVDATTRQAYPPKLPAIRFEPTTQIVPDICQTIHDRSTVLHHQTSGPLRFFTQPNRHSINKNETFPRTRENLCLCSSSSVAFPSLDYANRCPLESRGKLGVVRETFHSSRFFPLR